MGLESRKDEIVSRYRLTEPQWLLYLAWSEAKRDKDFELADMLRRCLQSVGVPVLTIDDYVIGGRYLRLNR